MWPRVCQCIALWPMKTVTKITYFKGERFYILAEIVSDFTCTKGNEVTRLCYYSIYWAWGTWNRFFFQLEFSPYITILGSEYNHFYTDMCIQSSETAHYLCPRRRMGDSDEQQPEGDKLVSLVQDCAKSPSLLENLKFGSSKPSREPTGGPTFSYPKIFF